MLREIARPRSGTLLTVLRVGKRQAGSQQKQHVCMYVYIYIYVRKQYHVILYYNMLYYNLVYHIIMTYYLILYYITLHYIMNDIVS